jgi:uncharacterized protein YkwD
MNLGLAGTAAAILAAAAVTAAPTPAAADDLAPIGTCSGADVPTASVADQQGGMLCLINYARAQHGLAALSTSDVLMRSAALKAGDEIACNEFTHTPCGKPVTDPFQRAGYVDDAFAWQVGENLANAQAPLGAPRNVMDGWLHSQAHHDNLLSPAWKEQGIALDLPPGSYLGLTGSAIWVSHFGERHPKPAPTSAEPQPPQSFAAPAAKPVARHKRKKRKSKARRTRRHHRR